MKHTISVLVRNESGVLSRVADLFSSRGYNIESLTVAPTIDREFSRITIITEGEDTVIEQITKQLNRLIPTLKIADLTKEEALEYELILCKVRAKEKNRSEVLRIAEIFGAKIIDTSNGVYTMQIVGDEKQINSFLDLIRPIGVKELVRSGLVAISRENQFINIKNMEQLAE